MGEDERGRQRVHVTPETVGDDLAATLDRQHGVIHRAQAVACGATDNDLRRMVRQRDLTIVQLGIYVDHTGALTWKQRAWAAVLVAYPAALSHESVLHPGSGDTIHIAVDRTRKVEVIAGVAVHYRTDLARLVRWTANPPAVRLEEALLDVAAGASTTAAAIGVLTDGIGRRTTADRVLRTLATRTSLPRSAFLRCLLTDIRDGTCSALEHGYLDRVERPHGLPCGRRQAPTTVGRPGFRDVDYEQWGLVVELDGRKGHDDAAARDRDLERDLDAAIGADRLTLRLGFRQVFGRACTTAAKVDAVLRRRGWTGPFVRCAACPDPAPERALPSGAVTY
ncbi:hypothetical protein MUG78_10585 [Gordonia alkaliphila]|uniref:hypothetical protein n=1 Tax=Gordonia alkaliphila TaxID=1053547 RepID=UPI001FF3A7CF|nr:hypothetical protein [Gordonia alkaliphila]MCK0439890.1 hypothetical protein [Gordonia alkaliphila]